MPSMYAMSAVRALHGLFTTVWLGGMIALAAAVLPVLWNTKGLGKNQITLAEAIQKRLRILAYVSMIGLTLTGFLLGRSGPAKGILFGTGTPYQTVLTIKHFLVLIMIAISLTRQHLTRPRNVSAVTKRRSIWLLSINIAISAIVLYLSSLDTALRLAFTA